MDLISVFFNGFWNYISNFEWWQGLIIIIFILITFFIGKFWKKVIAWIGEKISISSTETLQYRMFWGILTNATQLLIKDELRRSFKENGFDELNGAEFSNYVKDKHKIVMSMLKQHIINLYPPNNSNLIVSMDEIIKYIDGKNSYYEDLMFNIFTEAKQLKKNGVEIENKIEDDFLKDVEHYVKNNKNTSNCNQCLLILFQKREIYESKKDKIKILKNQMNFAEQKLIEIQADLLNFYSEKINKKR